MNQKGRRPPAAQAFRLKPQGYRIALRFHRSGKPQDLGDAVRCELHSRTDRRADNIFARIGIPGVAGYRKSNQFPRFGHKPCPDHGNQPLIVSILTWVYGCLWPILRFSFFLDL